MPFIIFVYRLASRLIRANTGVNYHWLTRWMFHLSSALRLSLARISIPRLRLWWIYLNRLHFQLFPTYRFPSRVIKRLIRSCGILSNSHNLPIAGYRYREWFQISSFRDDGAWWWYSKYRPSHLFISAFIYVKAHYPPIYTALAMMMRQALYLPCTHFAKMPFRRNTILKIFLWALHTSWCSFIWETCLSTMYTAAESRRKF